MPEYQLTARLIDLSVANAWDRAKHEWDIEYVWREDEPDTCLCGHYPIIEICQLKNRLNENTAIVGNCCVKKFTQLPSDLIFQAIKRVQDDIEKPINAETIRYAHQKKWLTEWEHKFYMDTWRKRKLTGPQKNSRIQINQKLLRCIVGARNKAHV